MNEIIVIRLAIHSIFESLWAKKLLQFNETLENMPMAREKKNATSLKQNKTNEEEKKCPIKIENQF